RPTSKLSKTTPSGTQTAFARRRATAFAQRHTWWGPRLSVLRRSTVTKTVTVKVFLPYNVTLEGSDFDDDGDDHGASVLGVAHPLADRPADHLLQLVGVVDPLARRPVQRLGDLRPDAVEDRVVLGEAPGLDLGPAGDLPGDGVHHHDDGDEALLAEDPAVLQRAVADVAHRGAVDVHVTAVHLARDPCHAVDEVDHDPVLGHDDLR